MGGSRERCRCVHLWIEDARWRFDNGDSAVVYHLGENTPFAVLEHAGNMEGQVLRVQLGSEGIGEGFALASRDGHAILLRCEVANDDRWVGGA